MSKAMLIIDMPNSCDKCELGYYADGRTLLCGYKDKVGNEERKPDWCPLQECLVGKYEGKIIKEMPKRKGLQGLTQFDTDNHYEMGWNACIDEILEKQRLD